MIELFDAPPSFGTSVIASVPVVINATSLPGCSLAREIGSRFQRLRSGLCCGRSRWKVECLFGRRRLHFILLSHQVKRHGTSLIILMVKKGYGKKKTASCHTHPKEQEHRGDSAESNVAGNTPRMSAQHSWTVILPRHAPPEIYVCDMR